MIRARAEELSSFVLASKTFAVKEAESASGSLFLLIREYPGNRTPLRAELGGVEIALLDSNPQCQGVWGWAEIPVPEGALKRGDNRFVLRAESSGMNSWSLAVSCEKPRSASRKSVDGGRSWPKGLMLGHDCTLTGEYVARLLIDPAVRPDRSAKPSFIYESAEHPALEAMCEELKLDKLCRSAKGDLERASRIMSWWTASWTYANGGGPSYAPWDPLSIIPWKSGNWGAGAENPTAFCVHSASGLLLLLRAMGLWARCIVTNSENRKGTGGHFLTELWSDEIGKWIVLDPHFDAVLTLNGEPASALELQAASEADECSRMGFVPGKSYGTNPRCEQKWLERWLAGQGLWELGYLERGDIVSHPEQVPPEHGCSVYHESCFLWLDTPRTPHRPYFPRWTRDREALNASPGSWSRG